MLKLTEIVSLIERVKVMEWAIKQATRYGKQAAYLGDNGMETDRAKVRKAWKGFLAQFHYSSPDRMTVVNAYWDAYCA